ncbi:MAG: hypothetical protein EZS28_010012 [Streblomastix strix]|uniref:Uncharacterized protein n=1 Tax=Streblomastix strix TaxID=222440 RepID=A0A5J4WJC1_9EUKA|nr:MAG: hypothetical protein EZS28_010012 [Streblomastix strix]
MAISLVQFSLSGQFEVNLLVFHLRIQVLKPDSIVIVSVLVVQSWVASCIDYLITHNSSSGSSIKRLDDLLSLVLLGLTNQIIKSIVVQMSVRLMTVGSIRRGLVTENLKIVVFLGTCQTFGMVIVSTILESIAPSRFIIRSVLVQTSPVVVSIILVPSQLRSIGLLAGQLNSDFLIIVSASTHAMVKLRVT